MAKQMKIEKEYNVQELVDKEQCKELTKHAEA